MKILEEFEYDEYGSTSRYSIKVTSDSGSERELEFTHCEDCPEDATLDRDYKDIKNIKTLLNIAYEAGKQGESFIEEERVSQCQGLN